MSYKTYITDAIVCGSKNSHTADRSFLLFTREAGMLYASARSVREERSKQRYALQECSHIRATLVRGKSGWKITGAESIQDLYAHATTREARALLRNILRLLRRVVHGETVHANIFDDVLTACVAGEQYPQTQLEYVLSLRILHALGYIAPAPAYASLLHSVLSPATFTEMDETTNAVCAEAIERALHESHL